MSWYTSSQKRNLTVLDESVYSLCLKFLGKIVTASTLQKFIILKLSTDSWSHVGNFFGWGGEGKSGSGGYSKESFRIQERSITTWRLAWF